MIHLWFCVAVAPVEVVAVRISASIQVSDPKRVEAIDRLDPYSGARASRAGLASVPATGAVARAAVIHRRGVVGVGLGDVALTVDYS